MSDRSNRDVGRKRSSSRRKCFCSCWLCIPGKVKMQLLREARDRIEAMDLRACADRSGKPDASQEGPAQNVPE